MLRPMGVASWKGIRCAYAVLVMLLIGYDQLQQGRKVLSLLNASQHDLYSPAAHSWVLRTAIWNKGAQVYLGLKAGGLAMGCGFGCGARLGRNPQRARRMSRYLRHIKLSFSERPHKLALIVFTPPASSSLLPYLRSSIP